MAYSIQNSEFIFREVELYLIRHGIAAERSVDIPDEERSLTKAGQMKTQKVANRLQELGLEFDLILTSPLVRARQTADILMATGLSSHLEIFSYLAPDGDFPAWLAWLEQQHFTIATKLALVGHQPNLGEWAEILIWGEAKAVIVLKKAGIIGLKLPETEIPVSRSQLFWLTPPKLLL